MSGRSRFIRSAAVLLCVSLGSAACDENRPAILLARGVASPSTIVNALVVPSTLPFQILPVAGCPLVSPFASAFSLVIDQRGGVDLLLHEVGFQFLDTAGFVSPLFFTRADLTLLFGSTFIATGTSRTFDFRTEFGCGFASSPRSMAARLVFLDRNGTRLERTMTAFMSGN